MPLLMLCLYGLVKVYVQDVPVSWRWALGAGAAGGCVLWIKYSMLGFFLAWGAAMLWITLRRAGWRQALINCGAVLAGVGLATLPWLVYFGVNGALNDWFTAYFYNNLVLYSAPPAGIAAMVRQVVQALGRALAGNKLQAALLAAGFAGSLYPLARMGRLRVWWLWAASFFALALTTYGAGGWLYYFQIFMVFLPLAFVLPVWLCGRIPAVQNGKAARILGSCLACVCLAAGVAAAWWRTPSRPLLGVPTSETVQDQFRQIVQAAPEQSMTMRHMLDGAFYTICDVYPQQKYIGKFNIPLPEMQQELERYVTGREVEFVVARCAAEDYQTYKAEKEPFILQNGYVQVADGEGLYLDNGKLVNMRYYLYQRAEHAPVQ